MLFILLFSLLPGRAAHATTDYGQIKQNVVDMVSRCVAADTTNLPGNETACTSLFKARLDQAGIPNVMVGPSPDRLSVVARLKGNGSRRPLLIMAHADVVPSAGQDWKTDPHKPELKDGYLYGRGVLDDLSYGAVALELMIEIKNSGTLLDRDLILAFTADEERGGRAGIRYILDNRPELIKDAEFALNEGGFTFTDDKGNPSMINISAAEKTYMDFRIVVNNVQGGPSWRAVHPNSIYFLSKAVTRIHEISFPTQMSPLTIEYFRAMAQVETRPAMKTAMQALVDSNGQPDRATLDTISSDPGYNGVIHTTCVPTTINAGNAPNVLAVKAEANVNCRIMPGTKVADVQASFLAAIRQDSELKALADTPVNSDGKAYLTIIPDPNYGQESPISPIDNLLVGAVKEIASQNLGGPLVVPSLLTAATDSRWTRMAGIPSYGLNAVFISPSDLNGVHGANERLPVAGVQTGAQFFHLLINRIASSSRTPNALKLKAAPRLQAIKAVKALAVWELGHKGCGH